jgi:xylulokinase
VPQETIGACYGSALLAAEGAALVAAGTSWARPDTTVLPRPDLGERYEPLYQLYLDLYPATAAIAHSLAGQPSSSGNG